MSGIFGIYHSDDRPINRAHLQKMAVSSAHRGPDGTRICQHTHIGFGHCMLCTTPESTNEHLPFTDSKSGLTITADARIDNRHDLARKLGRTDVSRLPDSQVILLAYQKWGTESFRKLIGDFSFVIWDSRKRLLFCVRDYIGVKPFYYHYSSAHFLFSSEIKQLAEYPGFKLTANEGMIGEYLSFSLCSKTETLFTDINRLAPGHYLTITPSSITTKQFWTPETRERIWYKKTSDYTEHFLEIFRKAVGSRLRGITQISAELSGGLDSSLVVGMACKVLRERNKDTPEVYSMVFPNLRCDEQLYINSVSDTFGIPVHCVPSHHYSVPLWLKQIEHSYEIPDMPNLSVRDSLIRQVSNSNSRILLSGIGGDEWFTGSGFPYLDLIKGQKYSILINEFWNSFSRNKHFTIKRFILNIIWPFIPMAARKLLCSRTEHSIPDWLDKDFLFKTKLQNQILQSDPRVALSNLGNCSPYKVLTTGTESFFLETMDRYHAKANIEYRSPFLDRNIAEFALSIPDYERQRNGQIKFLLRDQSNNLLPEVIRKRHDKAEFSYFFGKAFSTPLFSKSMNAPTIAHNGWINKKILKKKLQEKQDNFKKDSYHSGSLNWETWFVFAIELWYKSLFEKNNKA